MRSILGGARYFPGRALIYAVSLAALFTGASAHAFFGKKQEKQERLVAYAEYMARGDYARALSTAEQMLTRKARKKDAKGEVDDRALLAYAHMANALLWSGETDEALRRFDQVEMSIKQYETRSAAAGGLETIGAALAGNDVKHYRPKASDGVLVNTYKAIAFLIAGKLDDARIEFNRADERTRRAVEIFSKEIERKKESNKNKPDVSESQVDLVMSQHYGDLSQWAVYEDFVNPYTVYLHAIYFFAAGQVASDLENAVTSMERIVGMYPDNLIAAADLALFAQVASGEQARAEISDSVWLICEDGIGPEVMSKEVDFAVNVDNQVVPIRLVLPELRINPSGAGGCAVPGDVGLVQAAEIGSMDRVFQTEFKKRLPFEIAQGIISMLTRGALQNEAQKKGVLGQILGAVYQKETASTETRVWLGLPKTWYALRVPRPVDGRLQVLTPEGHPIAMIELPAARFTLAHVRNPGAGAYTATHVAVLATSP